MYTDSSYSPLYTQNSFGPDSSLYCDMFWMYCKYLIRIRILPTQKCCYVMYYMYVDITRNYYIAYFSNNGGPSHIGEPSIIIKTSESLPVYYSIEAPGVGYYTSGIVTSDNEVIIHLNNSFITLSHNDQDKGIHLMTSSDRVTLIGQNLRDSSSDTFLCLPVTDLCIVEYVYYGISVFRETKFPNNKYNSSILVVGTENSTMMKLTVTQPVTINVSNSTVNLTTGIQHSLVINRLQTVLIESVDDLTGTKIVTDKQVSVLSGHQCAGIPQHTRGCDHLVEQIPPTTLWGGEYYTAPLATRRSYTIKVLAAYNSTVVDIYCNNTRESYNISEGESVNKTLSLQEYCAINSSKEVLIVQLSHGFNDEKYTNNNGDPMMTLVPATNQYSNKFQFSTLQGRSGYTHYINIIVLAQYYQPNMTYLIVNNLEIIHEWVPIMVNNVIKAYGVRMILHDVNTVTEVVAEDALIGIIMYGNAAKESYGHPGGYDIQTGYRYLYQKSQALKKGCSHPRTRVKKDAKSKVTAKKRL